MGRIAFVVVLLAVPVFAAGGACPTGANYRNPTDSGGALVTLASLGVTQCYYFSSSAGSDSNNGTSEATPQQRLPKMQGYTGSLNPGTIGAGTGYILKGGDSWLAANLPIIWDSASGNSSNYIYIGVDPTWFTGGSWTRPKMDCQNTQCGNNVGIFGNSAQMQVVLSNYVYEDNIEWTGDLSDTKSQKAIQNGNGGGTADHNVFANNYCHGWSHTANSWASGNDTCYSDSTTTNSSWVFNVCDGADTTKDMRNCFRAGGQLLAFNYSQYTYEGSHGRVTDIHGNNFGFFILDTHPGGGDHANAIVNAQPNGVTILLMYNNVIHDDALATGMEDIWWCGAGTGDCAGVTTYMVNNVTFNVGRGVDIGDHPPKSGGTVNFYNNTIQDTATYCAGNGESPPRSTVNFENLHCIVPSGSYCTSTGLTCNNVGSNLQQTTAQANSNTTPHFDQYTSSQTYAFSPVALTNSTVGVGANLTSVCATIPALCSDTSYATYDSTNHKVVLRSMNARPSGGAPWDIGAYQFSSAGLPAGASVGTNVRFGTNVRIK